jgi:signal transduction histidine kinase
MSSYRGRMLRPVHWLLMDWLVALAFSAWLVASSEPAPLDLVVIAVVGLAMALRRRYPMTAWASILAALVLVGWPDYRVCALPAGYVIYTVAATSRRWIALTALAVTLLAPLCGHASGDHVAMAGLVMVVVWVLGLAKREHLAYQQDGVRREVAEERVRIARELHDVVAHSISVITVQAGFGGLMLDERPDQARVALGAIETTGREALAEMRRLLGVLRADGPPPGMADLERLVARTSEVRVELQITGRRRDLSTGVDLTGYRIVQEALTNVVKHARADTARVLIDYGDDKLSIVVTDDGVGCPEPRDGHGLTGMRERIRLYDGKFESAGLPERGFRVMATLPL